MKRKVSQLTKNTHQKTTSPSSAASARQTQLADEKAKQQKPHEHQATGERCGVSPPEPPRHAFTFALNQARESNS